MTGFIQAGLGLIVLIGFWWGVFALIGEDHAGRPGPASAESPVQQHVVTAWGRVRMRCDARVFVRGCTCRPRAKRRY